jgi:hypothetical protein
MSARGEWESRGRPLVAVVLLILAVLVPAALIAYSLSRTSDNEDVLKECREWKAQRAAPSNDGGVELQSNRARPSMVIALADTQSHVDMIGFSTKGRQTVPDKPRTRTSVVLTEAPRRAAAERFDGQLEARAETLAGATIVVLKVCVTRGEKLRAGAFQGTARIYGPRVADFDYAVIITEKWPWYIAAGILWYAGLLFVVAAWWTQSLTFSRADTPARGIGKHLATAMGAVIGFAAMVPTFFGTYWNNATWGSDPGTQLSGLATAGLTAAFAGLAAAHKLLESGPETPLAEDDEPRGPETPLAEDDEPKDVT